MIRKTVRFYKTTAYSKTTEGIQEHDLLIPVVSGKLNKEKIEEILGLPIIGFDEPMIVKETLELDIATFLKYAKPVTETEN